MKLEKSCGALVLRQGKTGKEILLIQHQNGGHWAFPKGHVEGSETEEETALREIKEETGLTVTLDKSFRESVHYSPAPGIKKDVIYYCAYAGEGDRVDIQAEELKNAKWVALEIAKEHITFENDRKLFQKLLCFLG